METPRYAPYAKKISLLSICFFGAVFYLPHFALAENIASARKEEGVQNFCARAGTLDGTIKNRIREHELKLATKRTEAENKVRTTWADEDKDRLEKMTAADAARETQFTELMAYAKNDTQRAAVTVFQTTVTEAVKTRRAAVDSAIKTYRDDILSLYDSRKGILEKTISSLKEKSSSALVKAKEDCVNGVPTATVRERYLANLKKAESDAQSIRTDFKKNPESREPIIAVRKAALQKAEADFKASLEKARTDLRVALKIK